MRVSERVRPLEVLERERSGERLRQSRLLVDLDHLSGAHDPQVGAPVANQRLGRVGVRVHDEDGVARAYPGLVAVAERVTELVPDRGPLLVRVAE